MNSPTAEYTIIRDFAAPRALVWAAWTEPERFARWFGPRTMATPLGRITLDTVPGGVWRVTLVGEEGFEATLDGRYREVRAPGRLVFTTGDPDAPGDGPASVVTLELTEAGGRTEMRFHQYGVNTDAEHAEQARAGWIEFFDRLAEHVEDARTAEHVEDARTAEPGVATAGR
ncbi:SRPBCC domain-containing protein [Actinomadura sp. ATCC 31491]|uniref:SRPBCC domain-containing protein n=1 Tax=Actinomadura luzonensis TaxID=2805427 RepID=A0ABT0GB46_9ACTN|nr:SRPBCC domain-containing protein [Actinomadura luzonensis]MCK2221831.1 SRPBCC domain-containing protein [Actinomadura luzonensis]